MESVLLILVQDFDVPAAKTLFDFIAKFPRVVCLVAIQSERAVAVQMEIWTLVGSVALSIPRQQADDVVACKLIFFSQFSASAHDSMSVLVMHLTLQMASPAHRLEIFDSDSRDAWWNFWFGLQLERRQGVPRKRNVVPHTSVERSPTYGLWPGLLEPAKTMLISVLITQIQMLL